MLWIWSQSFRVFDILATVVYFEQLVRVGVCRIISCRLVLIQLFSTGIKSVL